MAKAKKKAPAKKAPAKQSPASKAPAKKAARADKASKAEALTAALRSLDIAANANNLKAAQQHLEHAAELATGKKARAQVQAACQTRGNQFLWQQKWKQAIAFYDGGAAVVREGDDTRLTAEMLNECGFAFLQLHKLDEGEQRIRRALELHEQAKRLDGVASALYYLSSVVFERGNIEESVELARKAVAKSVEGGDQRGEVFHAYALARALYERGQTREAEEISRKAVPIASKLGLGAVEGNLVNMIANVALDDHKLDEAQQHYERAIELFKGANLKNHEAITISNIGNLMWDRGWLDDALVRYEQAIKLHKKAKDDRSSAIGLTARAGVFTEQGRFEEAQTDLEAALAIMMRIGHERRESFVRAGFARLAESRGELAEARAHYAETEMSLESAGDAVEVGRMLYAASGVEAELGNPETAETLIERAAALDPASLSESGEKRAGVDAVRALRELAIGRIEAARSKRASGEEARALRVAAQARLEAITRGADSLMARSSEVRRVAGRLSVQLDIGGPGKPVRFRGRCTGTGWKPDSKKKPVFHGELALGTEAGQLVAMGILAWDDRKAKVQVRGPAITKTTLRGQMAVDQDPAVWQIRVEVERGETEITGRFFEVYDEGGEKEMCTFTWPAVP